MPNLRKNSAPDRTASYFTKLSFTSNKTVKEKKFLGSPKLHRAIFGKNQQNDLPGTVIDHEVFSPISYTKVSGKKELQNCPNNDFGDWELRFRDLVSMRLY